MFNLSVVLFLIFNPLKLEAALSVYERTDNAGMYKPERFYAIETYLVEIGNEVRLLGIEYKNLAADNKIEAKKVESIRSEAEKSKKYYDKKINILKSENESLKKLVNENAFAIKLLIRNSSK